MSLLNKDHYRGCNACGGSGIDYATGDEPCRECRGTGRALTDIGKELVEFLKEHYGLNIKRAEI